MGQMTENETKIWQIRWRARAGYLHHFIPLFPVHKTDIPPMPKEVELQSYFNFAPSLPPLFFSTQSIADESSDGVGGADAEADPEADAML